MSPSIQSALIDAGGKSLTEYHGAMLPEYYSDSTAEHHGVRKAAGLFDFSFRAKFSVTGNDRVRFLHGMVSNDVKGLVPGKGAYATLLDVRGRILADLRIYCLEDRFLVDTDTDLLEKVLGTLNHYNIGGRVPLERQNLAALSLQGPEASTILSDVLQISLPGAEEFSHVSAGLGDDSLRVARTTSTGEEGFEIWVVPDRLEHLWEVLLDRGRGRGLLPCGTRALESLRIEAGIPQYGSDLGEDTLPLEAGLFNALSFTKGCYIGQEIVERARSRGHVNWKLVGLLIEAAQAPAPGEKLLRAGGEIGEITSACFSPTLGRTIALAYVRKEASEPHTALILASGAPASVTALPFYLRPPASLEGSSPVGA